jgi:hypothetical protein
VFGSKGKERTTMVDCVLRRPSNEDTHTYKQTGQVKYKSKCLVAKARHGNQPTRIHLNDTIALIADGDDDSGNSNNNNNNKYSTKQPRQQQQQQQRW